MRLGGNVLDDTVNVINQRTDRDLVSDALKCLLLNEIQKDIFEMSLNFIFWL